MASRNTISGNTVLGIAVSEDAVSEEKTFEKCAFHDFFLVDWPSTAYCQDKNPATEGDGGSKESLPMLSIVKPLIS